ncbi:MAG: MGMT family protein [Coriobacteriales bacterium]|jgi:alkylated DNA nucleotide flippase Atl1|nr:MGMT family protein [Coriobacteriales bacterium]
MARKTFQEKLNSSGDLPKIVRIDDPKGAARLGKEPGCLMLIAPALDYDVLMRLIPEGKLATSEQMRAQLARLAGADAVCPLTAGIFINVVAHASEERAGVDPVPWWRTLKGRGELNPKYPEGVLLQKGLLESEGHVITQKGNRFFVQDYEQSLYAF